MSNPLHVPVAFYYWDASYLYTPGDTVKIIRRLDPRFVDSTTGAVVDSFNPFFGGGNSLGYKQYSVSDDFTQVNESAPGASIETYPVYSYPRDVPRMGKVVLPEGTAGEKFAWELNISDPSTGIGFVDKWYGAVCPPFIKTLSIFQNATPNANAFESTEQGFTFTGIVKRPSYSVTYTEAGTDYHLYYPETRACRMEIDSGLPDGAGIVSFALDAVTTGTIGTITSWLPEASDMPTGSGGAETAFSFTVTLPPVGPDGVTQIRVRVIDDNGLCSPWYHPKIAPRANLKIIDQNGGSQFIFDASQSYSVDGTHTFTWFARNAQGTYEDVTSLVTVTGFGVVTVNSSDLSLTEPLDVKVRVTNTNGLYAERSFLYQPFDMIGAIHLPTGAFLSAVGPSIQSANVAISRRDGTSSILASLTTGTNRPTLVAHQIAGIPTGAIALFARVISSKTWRLWLSNDGARTLSPLATVFSSTAIDYAHVAILPGGACAVAVLKGATNTVIFKRTGDLANWPPDAQAVSVKTNVTNAPVYVLVSAQDGNELYITDAKTFWLTSKDAGRTWS